MPEYTDSTGNIISVSYATHLGDRAQPLVPIDCLLVRVYLVSALNSTLEKQLYKKMNDSPSPNPIFGDGI